MNLTVKDVLDAVWDMAPQELAEEWDNVGLLAGHPDRPVTKVLCALDLTAAVLDEALREGAELIVTHHPILFRGRKNLREDDPEGALLARLVRSEISMIAMHTNFDSASPGVNDALAAALGLTDVQAPAPFLRVGEMAQTTLEALTQLTASRLRAVVRTYGDPKAPVHRVAVLGGAGGNYYRDATAAGAQAFITGEIGYHVAMSAVDEGLCILEAGHDCTERVAIKTMVCGLQNRLNALQYKVIVMESAAYR
ncbi:MAG: Nif3-like dinuclear metal center hexameric protein [Clostridia bacterium]|nr:Nif3-like dinuclear metal center hexameric protein [Clostridia bacterium]